MNHCAVPAGAFPAPGKLRRLRPIRGDESGAALVEFSLVFGLFVFILYGLIAFGMMFALKQSVTNAAAEGARAVVGVADVTSTVGVDERLAMAKTTVKDRLSWLGAKYSDNDVKVSWYDPTFQGVGGCNYDAVPAAPPTPATVCVKITYPYSSRPLVPLAPGLGLVTPETLGSEARVQVG